MEQKPGVVVKGVGFTSLLTLIFITLKLVGVISWSWVWVLSPLWITAALGFLLFVIAIIYLGTR